MSEEDVAKQVKETLARLTTKGKNKTSKYRKEKREMVSGTGMFAEGNRVKAKEETPYAVYLDLSGSSTAEALASKGIYAYAYDDAAEAEAAE